MTGWRLGSRVRPDRPVTPPLSACASFFMRQRPSPNAVLHPHTHPHQSSLLSPPPLKSKAIRVLPVEPFFLNTAPSPHSHFLSLKKKSGHSPSLRV